MIEYMCIIGRDLKNNIVSVETTTSNVYTYTEVKNFINLRYTNSQKDITYTIIKDDVIYNIIQYFINKKEQHWLADKDDWKCLCNTLEDIKETVSNIKEEIKEKLNKVEE